MSGIVHCIERLKYAIPIVTMLLLLAGCGFQLRGSGLEMAARQIVFLEAENPYGPLERKIKLKLRAASIKVEGHHGSPDESVDKNIIKILRQQSQKNIISVDVNGRPAEYETIISLEVNFSYNNGLKQTKTFSVRRDFRYDSENNLAYDRETETITSEMYEELANRLLAVYLKQLTAIKTPVTSRVKSFDKI